jgi:lipopolysaccharide transport system permease protein
MDIYKNNSKPIVIEAGPKWMSWRHLVAYREVLRMLIFRDLKARYAQTWLGAGWVVFQPLFTVAIFAVVFGKWVHLETEGIPYFLFAFSGLVAWTYVSQAVQRASQSLTFDVRLITKVYFPRLLIPISSVVGTLLDFGILTLVLCIVVKIYGLPLTWQALAFPVCLLPLCFFALGIGAFVAAIGVYYRDIVALLPLLLQTWMYGSPIVYSATIVPEKWLWLYQLNPMVGVLDAIRWSFLGLPSFPWHSLSVTYAVSVVIFFIGIVTFTHLERHFADII